MANAAETIRFVCTGEFLKKSLLCNKNNFVAATCRKKSNRTEFVRLFVATKNKFSSTHEADVAETCRYY